MLQPWVSGNPQTHPKDRNFALSGLGLLFADQPRALPWAITFGPVGADFCQITKSEKQITSSLLNLQPTYRLANA